MASNQDRPQSTPISLPESAGVETVSCAGPSDVANPSTIAGEVALDMTSGMFDDLFEGTSPLPPVPTGNEQAHGAPAPGNGEDEALLRARIDQLQAELASARSEIEFAQLKEEELEKRSRLSQEAVEGLKSQVATLIEQAQQSSSQVLDLKTQLERSAREKQQLQEQASLETESSPAENAVALLAKGAASGDIASAMAKAPNERVSALEAENRTLREELRLGQEQSSQLEVELAETKLDAAQKEALVAESRELPMQSMSTQPTLELAESDDKPLLQAAYQQISVLNTQMAHLYTELTMARTELQTAKAAVGGLASAPGDHVDSSQKGAEIEKQNAQIADLISDIRHLQLDLEYHQQKLDQMIEEKQVMMKDMKKLQADLTSSWQQVEERDQQLKHREVDLEHAKQEAKRSANRDGPQSAEEDSALAALRSEASAKDSALIVSHYELHKEKLLRDRLEQKNLKLMDRMQKLMMVVETMRKENALLERNMNRKDRAVEDKDRQLRKVSEKANQLSKHVKAAGKVPPTPRSGSIRAQQTEASWEDRAQDGLPPLAGTLRSGASTPRTPQVPPSPYGGRGMM